MPLQTSKTRARSSRRTRAPLWRMVVPLLLLMLVPLFTYTAFEIASMNEREKLLQGLYETQLGTMLFSVNQYCWDVVNSWGNFLRAATPGTTSLAATEDEIPAKLATVLRRYAVLGGVFYSEKDRIELAVADSLRAQHAQLAHSLRTALAGSAAEIQKMLEQADKGYLRPAVLKLQGPAARAELLVVFAWEGRGADTRLCGFFFSSEDFVRQIIQPKITEFASQNFLLAVRQSGSERIFFSTQEVSHEVFEREEALWILPDMRLAIKLAGASAAELAAHRTRQTLFLIVGLDAIFLVAVVLWLRVILRETALARLKADFVDHVSHDLRTPLGLIRMFAETLELGRAGSEEKRQEYYRILSRETARLTRLVNNLLDFSRLEAGRKAYTKKSVALPVILHQALDSYRFHLQQRGFTLVEQFEDGLPAIHADAEAVTQAFLNLLDNAVKYSEEEKHITVKLRREGACALIEVADCGIGIATKHLGKVFGKFYRIEKVGQESRGAGIGLAIVQHVMDAHHGRVEVQSEPGKGSTFVLKFPLRD